MRAVSVVAPIQKRPWLTVATFVTLAALVTVVVAVMGQPGRRLLSRGGTGAEVRTPPLSQARWQFTARPAGRTGKITKQQSAAVTRQRTAIRTTVKSIYNGVFIEPKDLRPALETHFMPAAAKSFRRSGTGVSTAGVVRTTYRAAGIAAQPTAGVRRAVARVSIRAIDVGTKQRMVHNATLWLERPQKTWKVVAFDVSQKPVADRGPKNNAKKAPKKKGKKA